MTSEPRRLHPAGVVVVALERLRELIIPLLFGSGLTVLREGPSGRWFGLLAPIGAAVLLLAVAGGYAGWRATTYSVADGAVRFRRGLLRRNETSVPVERVASVDVLQGPVQRLAGVLEVRIQAAGGGRAAEIALPALSPAAVAELRAELGRPARADEGEGVAEAEVPVRRLSRRALVVAALTSGQLGVALPVVAAGVQTFDEVLLEDLRDSGAGLVPDTAMALAVLVLAVLAGAWLLSIAGTLIAFSGFRVTRERDRLRIERGFLQRRATTIPIARVQAVRVVEGVLRQPFGLTHLRIESAGYAAEAAVNTTLFPLLRRDEVPGFLAATVPELAFSPGALVSPPRRALVPFCAGPAVVAGLLAAAPAILLTPLALLAVPLAALHGFARARAAGWRIDGPRVLARSRALARTTVVARVARLQTRSYLQGPLERPLGLASFAFTLASRAGFTVAHVDATVARRLLDRLRPARRPARMDVAPVGGDAPAGA